MSLSLRERQNLAIVNAWTETHLLDESSGQIWWESTTEAGAVTIGLSVNK